MRQSTMRVRCKQGVMEITDRGVVLYGPFRQPVATLQRQAITGVSLSRGLFADSVIFQTIGNSVKVDMVNKLKARQIVRLFM